MSLEKHIENKRAAQAAILKRKNEMIASLSEECQYLKDKIEEISEREMDSGEIYLTLILKTEEDQQGLDFRVDEVEKSDRGNDFDEEEEEEVELAYVAAVNREYPNRLSQSINSALDYIADWYIKYAK